MIGSSVSLFLFVNLILELCAIRYQNICFLSWSQGVKLFQAIFLQLPLGFTVFAVSISTYFSSSNSEIWQVILAVVLSYLIHSIYIWFKWYMLINYKKEALANRDRRQWAMGLLTQPGGSRTQSRVSSMNQSVAYHIPYEPAYIENTNSDPPAYSDLSDHADQNGILPAAQERRDSFVTFDQNNSDPPAYSDISDQIDN